MILFAAACAGFAVLVIEVLGVHAVSPWFGNSSLIWSNQIGVILAALALGATVGGARARSSPTTLVKDLAGAFVLAGVLVGFGVWFLPQWGSWLLPPSLRLDEAAGILFGGSLATSVLLHAPPCIFLAMVSPMLVELRSRTHGAGQAAGQISAWGTLGSRIGVFGSSFFLIPFIGVRASLLGIAALLLAVGWWLARPSSMKMASSGGALILFAILPKPLPAIPADATVLQSLDGPLQHLRLLEMKDGARWLQVNEGLDSYQSVWRPHQEFPGGYYDLFALVPLYARVSEQENHESIWSLGFGAGSMVLPLAASLGDLDWSMVGVELDPLVTQVAAEWMPLPADLASHVEVVHGDGRAVFRHAPTGLSMVLLDAYARQFEIPLSLSTVEFFEEVHEKLRAGGVLALNLGLADFDDLGSSASSILAGMVRVFGEGQVRFHRVPFSRNAVVFACKETPLLKLEELGQILPPGLPVAVGVACLPDEVAEPASTTNGWLTDDKNPLLFQQLRAWWQT